MYVEKLTWFVLIQRFFSHAGDPKRLSFIVKKMFLSMCMKKIQHT